MAKVNVYVSNQGEIFEGTQAQLCKEYGIKQRNGFTRPTGALDSNGDRWKLEGEEFQKPNLYLGERRETSKGPDGKPQTVWLGICDTAAAYLGAQDCLERGGNWTWKKYDINNAPEFSEDDVVRWDYRGGKVHLRTHFQPFPEEDLAGYAELIKTVEGQYELIDNRIHVVDNKRPLIEQLDDISREWEEAHNTLSNIMKTSDVKAQYWGIQSRIYELDRSRCQVVVKMLQKERKQGNFLTAEEGISFQLDTIKASKERVAA